MKKFFEKFEIPEITDIIHFLEFQEGEPERIFYFEDATGRRRGEAGFNTESGKWELSYFSKSNPAPVMPDVKFRPELPLFTSGDGKVKAFVSCGRIWIKPAYRGSFPCFHSFNNWYDFRKHIEAWDREFKPEELETIKKEAEKEGARA